MKNEIPFLAVLAVAAFCGLWTLACISFGRWLAQRRKNDAAIALAQSLQMACKSPEQILAERTKEHQ